MKLALRISPSRVMDLLHQREAEALGGAALDLALDRERVDGLADVLRRADPDDARQAELDVDLDDDAHRGDRERDVRALAGDLAGLRVERRRARVAVDALDVDLAATGALALLERGAARVAHGTGGHPRHPRGGRRAGRADGAPSCARRARRRRCRARCARPGGSRRRRPGRPRRRRSAPPRCRPGGARRVPRTSRRSPPSSRCS